MTQVHAPVMLNEAVAALNPQAGGIYVDGTFGAGGYSRAILEIADTQVIAIDRDPAAIKRADAIKAVYANRFTILEGCFGDLANLLQGHGVSEVDGVVLDLGVSSPQIDEAERGFSFRMQGPLDMRMSQSGESAADVVNSKSPEELANIIYQLGEEKQSRRIARAIVEARATQPITTTTELANIVRKVVKFGGDIDPATRTFQALRLFVNDELGELQRALLGAEKVLKHKGRLVVVAFHSLEDRIVKEFMRDRSRALALPRHLPLPVNGRAQSFSCPKGLPILPSDAETRNNPRARSAKLRWAERVRENESIH